MASDENSKSDGKPVWLSFDVLEFIDNESYSYESPNQFLIRKFLEKDKK